MDRIPALPKGAALTGPIPSRCRGTWVQRMRREERRQMLGDRHRPDPGPPAAVRDAEGLVQVQMRDVAAELPRLGQPEEHVQVGPVDVDLATVLVDQRAHVADALLVDPVRGGVRDHDGRQALAVLLALATEVLEIHGPVLE